MNLPLNTSGYLNKNELYNVVDLIPHNVKRKLRVQTMRNLLLEDENGNRVFIKAIFEGEKRKPKAGEFFLSGFPVEAYIAKNDLEQEHCIAKLVVVKNRKTITYFNVSTE